MPGWVSPKHIAEPTGERGRIEGFPFKSEIRGNAREVRVYLPPGYDEGQERYPLLIVNNGAEAVEYGNMDHVLDNQIGHTVGPVIVAFAAGLPELMWQEYAGSLMGEYAQLIVEELVPHLDQRYRTIARPEARAIMGTFRGTVAALYTVLRHPQVFGNVAAQSPLLGWEPGGSDVLALVRDQEQQPVRFYVDWNRYDFRTGIIDIQEDSRELAELLRDKGYVVAGGEAAESFGWASWGATTDQLLEALFPLNAEH